MKIMETEPQPLIPQILSPCSSGRSTASDTTNSPEFEFWMVRNPSLPPPNLLSADQLFSDGHLLPLHLLNLSNDPPQPQPPPEPEPSAADVLAPPTSTPSKRWIHIFKKNDRKPSEPIISIADDPHKERDTIKEKQREKIKNGGGSKVVSAAELNINIWPFSRSRSAGNNGARPRSTASTSNRKVSSAPCSRSNSTGESKLSRKAWPNSPSRVGGVHLGRTSPVWQVRRGGTGAGRSFDAAVKNSEKGARKEGCRKLPPASGGSKGRVLSLNVPMCIGYRHQLSCRSDENSAVGVAAGDGGDGGQIGGGVSGEGLRRSNLFNIRSLFTKNVY